MRPIFALFCAASLALAQQDGLKPPPEKTRKGFETIKPEDAKEWLHFLAGPECEGRGTGQAGFQKAADFVAGKFKEWGLKPVGDVSADGGLPTYFQMVPFVANGIDPKSVSCKIAGGQEALDLKLGEGFGVGGTGKTDASGKVVFVVAPSASRKITEFDVAGKVVVALSVAEDGSFAQNIAWLTKLQAAKPAAVLRIDNVRAAQGAAEGDWRRKSKNDSGDAEAAPETGRRGARPMSFFVSRDVAAKIAAASGLDLDKLSQDGLKAADGKRTDTKLTATLKAESKRIEKGVPNVVGYLEGSDPALKKELVILGSHLDHLGRGRDGQMYPGADDDGSGSTALLTIARAFAQNGERPKRSLLFIAVCGEEMGLLGSDWYVEHPLFPIEDTVAELQMDMVGRWEEAHPFENPGDEKAEDNKNSLHLVGSKRISTELHEIVLKANADHLGFDFEYDGEKYYERSDHYNFARKGIPVTFMFTGVHKDYHQPTDTPDKIDYPKLCRVAKLNYLVAWEVADRAKRLVKDVKPGKKAR